MQPRLICLLVLVVLTALPVAWCYCVTHPAHPDEAWFRADSDDACETAHAFMLCLVHNRAHEARALLDETARTAGTSSPSPSSW